MFFILIGFVLGSSGLIIPQIISMILNVTSREPASELQLRQEIMELRRHLQTVSMVDQFAAYAKLQRKISAVTKQYREKVAERQLSTQQAKLVLNGILRGVIILSSLWIMWNYRSSPVVSLPPALLWPLSLILCLPSCLPGEISLIMWLMIVRTASGRFSKIMKPKLSHTRQSVL